jgi:hypothetical protein
MDSIVAHAHADVVVVPIAAWFGENVIAAPGTSLLPWFWFVRHHIPKAPLLALLHAQHTISWAVALALVS